MPYLFDDEDNTPMHESCIDQLIEMEKRYWEKKRIKQEAGDVNAEQQQNVREQIRE